jgi:hypothetical protein
VSDLTKYLISSRVCFVQKKDEALLEIKWEDDLFASLSFLCMIFLFLGLFVYGKLTSSNFVDDLIFNIILLTVLTYFPIKIGSIITFRCEVIIDQENISIVTSNFGIKCTKATFRIRKIKRVEKILVSSSIGTSGKTKIYRPKICFFSGSDSYFVVPVMLNDYEVDKSIELITRFME